MPKAERQNGDEEEDEEEDDEDEVSDDGSSSGGSSEDNRSSAVKALDTALKYPLKLKLKVDLCFRHFASAAPNGGAGKSIQKGQKVLNLMQARQMAPVLAEKLHLPTWLFRDIDQLFDRFDFSGQGLLTRDETSKMFRRGLQQRRVELGGRKQEVCVQERTLDDAGYTVIKELGRGGQGIMYLCDRSSAQSHGGLAGTFGCPACGAAGDHASGPHKKLLQLQLRRRDKALLGASGKFCVKFYDKENANACDMDELIAEYALMRELDHRNISRTYEVFQDRAFYYLVNEPYYGGDLTKIGERAFKKGVRMSENWWRGIFRQSLEGLKYLHSCAMMHCDIKEANIMVAKNDSYRAPEVVLIDFGLACSFGSLDEARSAEEEGVGSPAGTPGYIPPETWDTEVWYPNGDIFSMGIVFLQIMVGQIPSENGLVEGVLQQGDSAVEMARDAHTRPFPWHKFPRDMPGLRSLIDLMTLPDRRTRPRAVQALEHAWFASDSDADLPNELVRDLVGTSSGESARERVVDQLLVMNNLDELRQMQANFDEAARSSPRPVAAGPTLPLVSASHRGTSVAQATALLEAHGVDSGAAKELVEACTTRVGMCDLTKAIEESVVAKESYTHQFIQDLFDELDSDRSGSLSKAELRALLNSDAFECPYEDIDQVMSSMDADHDSFVSYAEFKKAILRDGRVARRSEVNPAGISAGSGCACM